MTTSERSQITFGDTVIDYGIIRSKRRRKTVEIILDPAKGVLVAVPWRADPADISAIVRKRAPWIVRKSTEQILSPRRKLFVSGESLPYIGRQARLFVELKDAKRVSLRFEHWAFHVDAPASANGEARRAVIEAALIGWYKGRALELLSTRVDRWSKRLGVKATSVLVRNQRQRWGSCAPDGSIRFNWRAVMLEPSLIDYVVVHELAHLLVRNHSTAFWSRVGAVLPDFKVRRARLREAADELVL